MVSAMAVAPVSATFPTHPPPLHAGGVQQSAKMETEKKKKSNGCQLDWGQSQVGARKYR